MSTFLTAVGGVVAVLAMLAALCLSLAVAAHFLDRLRTSRDEKVRALCARTIGNELRSSSWWFGESPDAALVLRLVGQALCERGCYDIDQVRDQWRKNRAPKEAA
jgi:hypothetical protein